MEGNLIRYALTIVSQTAFRPLNSTLALAASVIAGQRNKDDVQSSIDTALNGGAVGFFALIHRKDGDSWSVYFHPKRMTTSAKEI